MLNLPNDQLLAAKPFSQAEWLRPNEHFVQFYESDFFLLDSVTQYLAEGLRAGDNCLVIGTRLHREALAVKLLGHGFDVVNDGLGDRYFAFDAQETLSRFFVNDAIQPHLFTETVQGIVRNTGANGRQIRAFGEMVALLAAERNFAAAVQLEELWNELRTKMDFALFCAYALSNFSSQDSRALIDLCEQHSMVVPAESYHALTKAEDRRQAIVVLQQKARSLESEISDREKAEYALRTASDDLKRLLVSEQIARAEAEKANDIKDEFLATVSHELRTPLNAIIGWTQMLRLGKLDKEATDRAIQTIERKAKAQAQLIEDILDVSRVITGKLQLQIARVDAASIIGSAIDSIQPAADAKEIQIEVMVDPALRHISGDATRLQQVVWNLLANAVKFTPAKGRVEVSLRRKDPDVQITVTDTGQGFDAAFAPFIFDRFRQANAGATRNCGGLGLGLSIVRHLVELHGGTVAAHSDGEGQGATFTITLPNSIRQLSGPGRKPIGSDQSDEDNPAASIAGQRILLVADDDHTLKMLAGVLQDQGAIVEAAGSAREAIEVLERFQADVIVSDFAMPDDDGYSLIQAIRAGESGDRKLAQAIALTALVRVEDRARALPAGFNIFLPKPVKPHDLVIAIGNLIVPD